jgi:hypothetical protein
VLIRFIFLLVMAGAAFAVWRSLQKDPRLRVPRHWRAAAAKQNWLHEALELRQKIIERVVAGQAAHAGDLVADVDEVVERLVDISKVEGHLASASDALRERLEVSLGKLKGERTSAMGWLAEAYAVLIESAAHEFDATVDRLQGNLRTQKEELRLEVEARREINAALKKRA